MKSMTPRQHKVATEVQHACALALVQGRIASTLPLTRVTIIDCWVSADLRLARLYLQLPDDLNTASFFTDINMQIAKPLRKYLASHLATKFIPDVAFFPAEDEQSYPAPNKHILK